jgi:hypothetical protein
VIKTGVFTGKYISPGGGISADVTREKICKKRRENIGTCKKGKNTKEKRNLKVKGCSNK